MLKYVLWKCITAEEFLPCLLSGFTSPAWASFLGLYIPIYKVLIKTFPREVGNNPGQKPANMEALYGWFAVADLICVSAMYSLFLLQSDRYEEDKLRCWYMNINTQTSKWSQLVSHTSIEVQSGSFSSFRNSFRNSAGYWLHNQEIEAS